MINNRRVEEKSVSAARREWVTDAHFSPGFPPGCSYVNPSSQPATLTATLGLPVRVSACLFVFVPLPLYSRVVSASTGPTFKSHFLLLVHPVPRVLTPEQAISRNSFNRFPPFYSNLPIFQSSHSIIESIYQIQSSLVYW